jgi:excisionase family DNA binding protein
MSDPLNRIACALECLVSQGLKIKNAPGGQAALSKEDAARYLGVTEATRDQLVRSGKLHPVRTGDKRGMIFEIKELDAFLRKYRQEMGE